MSYWVEKRVREGQPPLSPLITPEEERWWAKERKKFYKKSMLRVGLPLFLMGVIGAAIAKPERMLFFVPFYAIFMFGMAWTQTRFHESRQRQQEVRWKRIRESLLAESIDENP